MEASVEIFTTLAEASEPLVLILLVEAKGSCPAPVGSRMLWFSSGKTLGTVGGGKLEEVALEEAPKVLEKEKPTLKTYELTEKGIGMWCGGKAILYFEPHFPRRILWIFGYGHIGKEVASLCEGLPFQVTVVDDKATYPHTHKLDWKTLEPFPPIQRHHWVLCLMRDPEKELMVLRRLSSNPPKYIGIIGSQRKKKKMLEILRKDGIDGTALPLHSPVGLAIGARTPKEIAISITAELIQSYRAG